jgi:2-C-methyl-D-erythritol 4-phosphate cytidylyltransferase/2-C-methyl-D-erythritol 2,4-cyclodiphosphate synthase
MRFSCVIVAAGQGVRAGAGEAKQWRLLGGQAVLRWSAQALLAAGAEELVVCVRPEDRERAKAALAGLVGWALADGGPSRAQSVRAGLAALSPVDAVLIHDAARPFIPAELPAKLLAALEKADGAVPALPVADTLKKEDGERIVTADRAGLWKAQTPQAFRLATLVGAYDTLPADAQASDDAGVVEAAGGRIALIGGHPMLFKLTFPEDFDMAETLAGAKMRTRTGMGFDVHRLTGGDGVWLCGVKIACDFALEGHSDADVGLHALTDALLGAIGKGDIGQHFPPSDPQWKDAASDRFAAYAAELVAEAGAVIANVDVTLICEQPKIGPHRQAMCARIAEILRIDTGQVSVKATTTEGLGFAGRGEGIAAQAVATVSAP